MNILKIYAKYLIPEHLQMHMIRVAACGNIILDHWIGKPLPKESILRILLLHDMGNIVKITPDQIDDPSFLKAREQWIEQYGKNDHVINNEIARREGITEEEITIMDEKILKNNEKTAQSGSYTVKLCAYCDQRVTPEGVAPIKDRLEELRTRHQKNGKGSMSDPIIAEKLITSAIQIEEQLFENCSITPNDITDESIMKYMDLLKDFNVYYHEREER